MRTVFSLFMIFFSQGSLAEDVAGSTKIFTASVSYTKANTLPGSSWEDLERAGVEMKALKGALAKCYQGGFTECVGLNTSLTRCDYLTGPPSGLYRYACDAVATVRGSK